MPEISSTHLFTREYISATRKPPTDLTTNPFFSYLTMAEEDQESNFDEAHEEGAIKVSVTFKPQERVAEAEVKFPDNNDTFQDVNLNESSSKNQLEGVQATCDDPDSRDVCLPIDPSATSVPLAAAAAGKAENDVSNLEVTRITLAFL